jgi:hypothetical protein
MDGKGFFVFGIVLEMLDSTGLNTRSIESVLASAGLKTRSTGSVLRSTKLDTGDTHLADQR